MEVFKVGTSMSEKLRSFWAWCAEGQYKIKNKDGEIEKFYPNAMQQRLFGILLAQAKRKEPIRAIILKARKEGCSTFVQLLFAFLCQFTGHWKARTIAHTEKSTTDIHEISQRLFGLYRGRLQPISKMNPIRWEHDSDMSTETAGGLHVSSGANTNVLHLSEMAKWQNTRTPVQDQLASVLQSVPENPNSIIIIESTANMLDLTGEFKLRWEIAEGGEGGYKAFFSPWFEDPTNRLVGAEVEKKTDYESWLVETFDLDDEQVAWRRKQIAGPFRKDDVYFKQEFPATPEEAFQMPTGKIYPMLAKDKHDRNLELGTLIDSGYNLYRGIDWGGVDPFVCLWIAHKTGEPGFSVHVKACPNTWRELTGYPWTESGRPADRNNHTCDTIRYLCSHFDLSGHIHVYREMYIPHAAAHGLSILNHARDILRISAGEPIIGTVADRSQPGSITLMTQQGLPCEPNRVPNSMSQRGEVIDGINLLQALMFADVPVVYPPPPEPWQRTYQRRQDEFGGDFGVGSVDTLVALQDYERATAGTYDEIFGAF